MKPIKRREASLWYTRNKNGVRGPFTLGMVRRFVLIGRVQLDDEVSSDKQSWQAVKDTPTVIPDEMRDAETEEGQQRLLQAQLREDERSRERRRQQLNEFENQRSSEDRRQQEDYTFQVHRKMRNQLQDSLMPGRRSYVGSMALLVVVLLGFVAAGGYLYTQRQAIEVERSDCNAAPGPAVNWSHCQMEGMRLSGKDLQSARLNNTILYGSQMVGTHLVGAELSYANLGATDLSSADLQEALLIGTNLRGANLEGADLRNADLSHADLRHANISGVDWAGARLDKTIWVDGNLCMPGSVGRCRHAGQQSQ